MKTKNLYVGQLGEIKVTEGKQNSRTINGEDYFIVFMTNGENNRYGIDVLTDKKYLIWERCNFKIVKNKVGYKAIGAYEGIENHMLVPSDEIDINEIRMIFHRLNNKSENEENKYPKDLVLKCIYETSLFLKSLEIDESIKNDYSTKLIRLSENYVKELIEFNERIGENNSISSEKSIRYKYIDLLIQIEDELKHLDNVKSADLKEDLYSMLKQMSYK